MVTGVIADFREGGVTIEQWQIEMAIRPAPAVAAIVERSTPVLPRIVNYA